MAAGLRSLRFFLSFFLCNRFLSSIQKRGYIPIIILVISEIIIKAMESKSGFFQKQFSVLHTSKGRGDGGHGWRQERVCACASRNMYSLCKSKESFICTVCFMCNAASLTKEECFGSISILLFRCVSFRLRPTAAASPFLSVCLI